MLQLQNDAIIFCASLSSSLSMSISVCSKMMRGVRVILVDIFQSIHPNVYYGPWLFKSTLIIMYNIAMLVHRQTQTGNPISSLFNVYNICSFESISRTNNGHCTMYTYSSRIYVNSLIKHEQRYFTFATVSICLASGCTWDRCGKLFNEWRKTEQKFEEENKIKTHTHTATKREENIIQNKPKEKQSTNEMSKGKRHTKNQQTRTDDR